MANYLRNFKVIVDNQYITEIKHVDFFPNLVFDEKNECHVNSIEYKLSALHLTSIFYFCDKIINNNDIKFLKTFYNRNFVIATGFIFLINIEKESDLINEPNILYNANLFFPTTNQDKYYSIYLQNDFLENVSFKNFINLKEFVIDGFDGGLKIDEEEEKIVKKMQINGTKIFISSDYTSD